MITESRPLLSRVADSVYWMARYIERAENVARFIGVNLHLQLDLPLEPAHRWQPLIDTSGDAEVFQQRYGEASQANVIRFLTADADNPNSIFSCLRAARKMPVPFARRFRRRCGAGKPDVSGDTADAGASGGGKIVRLVAPFPV